MKVTKEQFIGVTYDELLAENDELLANNVEYQEIYESQMDKKSGEVSGDGKNA